jgi:transketolase
MIKILKSIRIKILKLIFTSKASHLGSIFSCVDIIYFIYKNFINKKNYNLFILSKGHAGLAYYVILNHFKKISNIVLKNYYRDGSALIGHISHKVKSIKISTGSLGQGLPISAGLALQKKIDKKKGLIFCLISDGECQEGSNWEAALFAKHNKLNNLIVIMDYNKLQSLMTVKKTIDIEPLEKKWKAFGWNVFRCNGHDLNLIEKQISKAIKSKNYPSIIICDTIKGKGSKLLENKILWHYRCPSIEELKIIESEINMYK